MPHHCTTCRAPLHNADGHAEEVAPPIAPSSREPARKRQRGRPVQRSELSELTSAQCPRASPSPSREQSPVLFSHPEQRSSADASNLVSFGGSDEEQPDDSVSLAASEPEHWLGESDDPNPLPPLEPIDHGSGMGAELFRILSKAVEKLDLDWAPLEEPSRSRLDEWFLPGRRQAPRQRSAPFFPEVHEELAKSWRAPYSARLHTSHWSALTSVDGSEEKGYEHLPPLDEAVAAHLCPPAADKTAFLDAPVSPSGLFGPAVEGFTERFTAAQKSSQATRHFLPKRSSSASAPSRPRPAPAQQTKPAPSASQAAPPIEHRHRSRSSKRTTFPRHQGPRPKIVLDPAPPKSS
ncbi:hypothetical protein DPX16_0821 [Anabarilius grahami]|uniref:Uncharacterized protein n=1 Tax=Anabarilius grahami TaxID=495550 RepID=A0A3N0YKN1_ANAGA|nr:hypothetical protein DPX16_0821 [Anabarilius grahami]